MATTANARATDRQANDKPHHEEEASDNNNLANLIEQRAKRTWYTQQTAVVINRCCRCCSTLLLLEKVIKNVQINTRQFHSTRKTKKRDGLDFHVFFVIYFFEKISTTHLSPHYNEIIYRAFLCVVGVIPYRNSKFEIYTQGQAYTSRSV